MIMVAHIAVILILTVLTQVGGVIYFVALALRANASWAETRLGFLGLFLGVYALAWFPVEKIAEATGRAALPCHESVETPLTATLLTCALHRHYVRPELAQVARSLALAANQAHPGTLTQALDANAPFLDGYPLLPHLSHDDGRKLDLAFYYGSRAQGDYRRGALASPLGYWAFEQPRDGEPRPCISYTSRWRWDMGWYQPFVLKDYALEPERTRFALRWLASEGRQLGVGRVFIEPHLARRLDARGEIIGFQGCGAARHDDHIHVQMR